MMLTADRCFEQYFLIEKTKRKLDFAAVHDCFWSHPCDVDKLNEILREQFVCLHNQPILEQLKGGLESILPGFTPDEIPDRGVFDLNEVKKSTYFFS